MNKIETKLPLAMGRVNEVTVKDGTVLLPLTPLDARGTHFMATIIYDLHKLGYDKKDMEFHYKDFLKNPIAKIISYVEENDRMIWQDIQDRNNSEVSIVPIKVSE